MFLIEHKQFKKYLLFQLAQSTIKNRKCVLRENMNPLRKPPASKSDYVAHALKRFIRMIQQNSYVLTNGIMMVRCSRCDLSSFYKYFCVTGLEHILSQLDGIRAINLGKHHLDGSRSKEEYAQIVSNPRYIC